MNLNDGPVEARITAGLMPATRAVGTNWNADRIGVRVTGVSGTTEGTTSLMQTLYKNVLYSTSSTEETATFTATTGEGIFFQDANETVTFAAYAPYQESTADTLPGTNADGVIDVNTEEDDNNGDNQESIDFLFASGATASRSNPTVEFSGANAFEHKMAQLNIVFQTSTNDGFTADQVFEAGFNLGGLVHEGTFDVTTGTAAATGTAVSSWDITDCKHSDATATRTYSLILLPQDCSGSALNVSVTIDEQTYSNSTSIAPNLEAGNSYTYTITVKKTGLQVSGCTITKWTEATGGSGDAVMQ